MSDLCCMCRESTTNIDTLCCRGCNTLFHLKCLATTNQYYNVQLVQLLCAIKQLHWYCDQCHIGTVNTLIDCARTVRDAEQFLVQIPILIRKFEASSTTATTQASSNGSNSMEIGDVQNASIAATKPISSLTSMMGKKVLETPRSNKRKNDGNLDSQRVKLQALSTLSAPSASANGITVLEESKAVYVSNFDPTVDESHILKYLTEQSIDTSAIQCQRLVKKNWKKQKLSFVSFKINAPTNIYDKIIEASFWPNDTVVNEFVTTSKTMATNDNKTVFPKGKINKAKQKPKQQQMKQSNKNGKAIGKKQPMQKVNRWKVVRRSHQQPKRRQQQQQQQRHLQQPRQPTFPAYRQPMDPLFNPYNWMTPLPLQNRFAPMMF